MPNGYMGAMGQQAVGMANPRQPIQATVMPEIQGRQRGQLNKKPGLNLRGRGRNAQLAAQKLAAQRGGGARGRVAPGLMGRQRFAQNAAQRFGTMAGRPSPDGFGGRVRAMPQRQAQARQRPRRMARQLQRGVGARQRFR